MSEIADAIRAYHKKTDGQAQAVRKIWHLQETAAALRAADRKADTKTLVARLKNEIQKAETELNPNTLQTMAEWEELKATYNKDELVYYVRDREIRVPLFTESLSHSRISKIQLPQFKDPGEIYSYNFV